MIEKKKKKFYLLIIFIVILVFLVGKYYFYLKKDNEETKENKVITEKKDNYKKAKYKYEGTYKDIVYHTIKDEGRGIEENTKHYENDYFVVIRDDNNTINLYDCSEKNGCVNKGEGMICNSDYTICTKNTNSEIGSSTYTYTFKDKQLEIREKSSFVDNSSLEYIKTGEWYNDSIEVKEYTPPKEEKKPTTPQIGMSKSEVLSIWGTPEKKNIHTYSWGTSEQWVYSKNRYVYFDDDVVTSVTTQE